MTITTLVRRATICILWLLAIWNSWECRGLFSDGALELVETVQKGGFFNFDTKAREYAIGTTQIPLVVGLKLGVTDLHWLSRLLSFGLFALPTILYQIALMRAKDDAVLLAAVVAAISLVFLTGSFFIVGEYNTAYALAIAAAAWVTTSERPRLLDGIALVMLAVLALRTYEVFTYLGPLLAVMIVCAIPRDLPRPPWLVSDSLAGLLMLMGLPITVAGLAFAGIFPAPIFITALLVTAGLVAWRHPRWRPSVAGALYLLAAALFLAGAVVALDSSTRVYGLNVMQQTLFAFWPNAQFDLALVATLIVVIGSLARPEALHGSRLYLWAGLPLALLALSPLLALSDSIRPLGTHAYAVRTICGFVIVAIVSFIWARGAGAGAILAAFATLEKPEAAHRLLKFSFVMLLAALPAQILATTTWISFLDTVRTAVRTHQGTIAQDAAPPAISRYYWDDGDMVFISDLSLILRSKPGDGVITSPEVPEPRPPQSLGNYFWRD